ncbi:MAG TPA: DUF2510 domain-containing protein [Acidimicrobiales bacterium]|nr:DUF2510 domain-containing protein [Acidimicrobiales bacterium]
MTTPAPGWLPDPTGRHEYRYWDGASWTSDVSDAGTTAIDALTAPLPAPGAPAAPPEPGDPTQVIDGTGSYAPPTATFGPPTAPYDASAGGAPPSGPYVPPPGTGGYPQPTPRRSGPSTGLLVGLAVLAVALIAGIGFVLASGDDGDDDTATGTTTSTTAADDDTSTTLPPDDGDDGDDSGDGGLGSGDVDLDDPDTREAVVDVVAGQLEEEGLEREQAECLANGVLDGLSPERLAEIGESGGDISSLTPEEMSSVFSAVLDCGVTDFPGAGAPGT